MAERYSGPDKYSGLFGITFYYDKLYNGSFHFSVSRNIFKIKYYVGTYIVAEGGINYKVPSKLIAKHDKVADENYFYSSDRLTFGSGVTGKIGFGSYFNIKSYSFAINYVWFREQHNWDPYNNQAAQANYFISRDSRGRELMLISDIPFFNRVRNKLYRAGSNSKIKKVLLWPVSHIFSLDFYMGYRWQKLVNYTPSSINPTAVVAPPAALNYTKENKLNYWFFGLRAYLPLY